MNQSMSETILPTSFFQRSTELVAQELLGKLIFSTLDNAYIVVRIVETEAYGDEHDAASHAAFGKKKRNDAMFGPVGHTYVYLSYGIHFCLNIVARESGVTSGGVLIRAVEPLKGLQTIHKRRGSVEGFNLTNGPGKVGQALGLGLAHNHIPLFCQNSPLTVTTDPHCSSSSIIKSTRIGISRNVHAPWRFYLKDNQWVTPKR